MGGFIIILHVNCKSRATQTIHELRRFVRGIFVVGDYRTTSSCFRFVMAYLNLYLYLSLHRIVFLRTIKREQNEQMISLQLYNDPLVVRCPLLHSVCLRFTPKSQRHQHTYTRFQHMFTLQYQNIVGHSLELWLNFVCLYMDCRTSGYSGC